MTTIDFSIGISMYTILNTRDFYIQMNTEVKTEDLCKTLEEVRKLLKECVLPRLDQLESDLFFLRRHTWPVCAHMNETTPLSTEWVIDKAMSTGEDDDYLVYKKNRISKLISPDQIWRHNRTREEKMLLNKYK